MKKITVPVSKKYDVLIGAPADDIGALVAGVLSPRPAALITESRVDALYGDAVSASLERAGFEIRKFVFPAGEQSKNSETFIDILEFLAENHYSRSDAVIALGGGVAGDLAGFAASVYLRGISFVQIPTTLLAAVDSSVGGKTAINLTAGKNLAGSFYQPKLVVCCPEFLDTLPGEIFSDGWAEVIKYAGIDPSLWDVLTDGTEHDMEEIIARCVQIKSDIVGRDEFESGERRLLNYGHTIAHGIEKCSNYTISHGSAVAIGMVCITRAAAALGFCSREYAAGTKRLVESRGLPTECPYSPEEIHDAALSDKKHSGGRLALVMPVSEGKCVIHSVTDDELMDVLRAGIV